MAGIIFLILAFSTAYTSIKISFYANELDKHTKIGGMLIGGVFLAAITSFPELVTALSAVFINNPGLAIGDVFGSNIFNLLIIATIDLFFIREMLMNKISTKYSYLIGILILIHVLIFVASTTGINDNEMVSVFSLVIFILYIVFVILISRMKVPTKTKFVSGGASNIIVKFILCAIVIVVLGIMLTLQANKIVVMNPLFSSSTVGAFLLGITTSLPEAVTVYTLIKLRGYNIAFSNIVGSNTFNFLIFAICDLFVRGKSLYYFQDNNSLLFLTFGLIMHIILFLSLLRKRSLSMWTYAIPSILIVISYFYIFYLQFF
jgi:cation:H+ antiporter